MNIYSITDTQDSCLGLVKALIAKVGVPLQGSGKFAREAYNVVRCLLRLKVLSPIVNKYLYCGQLEKAINCY